MKLLPTIFLARSLSVVTLVSFVLGALPFWVEASAKDGAMPAVQSVEDHTLDSLWNQNLDDPTPQIRPKPAAFGVEKPAEKSEPKPVQAKAVQTKARPEKPAKSLSQKTAPLGAVKPSAQSSGKQVGPEKNATSHPESTPHKTAPLEKSSKKPSSSAPQAAIKTEKTVPPKKAEKPDAEKATQPALVEPAPQKAKPPAKKKDSKRKKRQWAPMVETNLTPLAAPARPMELKSPEKPGASNQPNAEPKTQRPKAEKKPKTEKIAPSKASQTPQSVQPASKSVVLPEAKPAQLEKPAKLKREKLKKEKLKKEKKKKTEKPKHEQPSASTEKQSEEPMARKSEPETQAPESSLPTQPLQASQPEKPSAKPPQKVKVKKAHAEKPRLEKPKREKPKREKSPKSKRPQIEPQKQPTATEKRNVSPVDVQVDSKPADVAPPSIKTSKLVPSPKETVNKKSRDKSKKSKKRASEKLKPAQTTPESAFPPSDSIASPNTKTLEEQAFPAAGKEKKVQARKPKTKIRKNKSEKAKTLQAPKTNQEVQAKPSAMLEKPENDPANNKQVDAAPPSSETPLGTSSKPVAPVEALPAPSSESLKIQSDLPVAQPETTHPVESLPYKQTPAAQPATSKVASPKGAQKHVKPTAVNSRKKTSSKEQTNPKPVLLPQILPFGLKALPTTLQAPADARESSSPVVPTAPAEVEKPSNQVLEESPKAESKLAPQPASQTQSKAAKPEPAQIDSSVELFPDASAQPASKSATPISEPSPVETPANNAALLREQAQEKVKLYATALNQWRQSSHPENLEPILNKGQEAAYALLKVAEDLEDGEFRDVALQMQGYLMIRDEVLVITPDPSFFLALAKQKGKPVDVTFFELMGQTVNGYWPTTMEQMDDLSGCSRFGSGELVRLYGEWKSFQKLHPTAYQKALQDPNLLLLADIEDQLAHSTSACDGPDAVISELQKFIAFYPKSPLTPVLQKRLNALKQSQSDFNFYQGIKHRVNNPESP